MHAAHHHCQTGLFVAMFYGSEVASTSHPFPFDALLLQPSCESSPELFHPKYTKHIIILKNKKVQHITPISPQTLQLTQSLLSSSGSCSVLGTSLSSSKAAKLATLNAERSSSPTVAGASSRVSARRKISSMSHCNNENQYLLLHSEIPI